MHCFVYLSIELLNNLEWDFAVFKFTSLLNSFKAFSRFIVIRSVPGTGGMVWFPGGNIWPCILASPSLPEQVCTPALGFLWWLPCPDGLLHVCFILVSLVEARNSLSMTLSFTQTPVWANATIFLFASFIWKLFSWIIDTSERKSIFHHYLSKLVNFYEIIKWSVLENVWAEHGVSSL